MSEMTSTQRILPRPCTVGVLLPPEAQLTGVIGLVEAFDTANRVLASAGKPPQYVVHLLGVGDTLQSAAGAVLQTRPAQALESLHTLVIGGALPTAATPVDPALRDAVAYLAARAERWVTVCLGTFALGELGYLNGRRCTTHWLALDALRRRFPAAHVEEDAIFTEDGPLLTSAGGTAGIDLALHLLRRDRGPRLALAVARALVVFAQRPGGQSQFGAAVRLRPGLDDRLQALVMHVMRDPAADHSVAQLAAHIGMSPRHFARVFRDQTGETPAVFVARARVEAAQRALATSDASLAEIAAACGFGSEDTLRRTFHRIAGVSPSDWRTRFAF